MQRVPAQPLVERTPITLSWISRVSPGASPPATTPKKLRYSRCKKSLPSQKLREYLDRDRSPLWTFRVPHGFLGSLGIWFFPFLRSGRKKPNPRPSDALHSAAAVAASFLHRPQFACCTMCLGLHSISQWHRRGSDLQTVGR